MQAGQFNEVLMAQLQKGDVVRLKSGGPKMTVTGFDDYGQAWVSWFDDNLKPQTQAFAPEALKLEE